MITIKRPGAISEDRLELINIYEISDAEGVLVKALPYYADNKGIIERKKKRSILCDFMTIDIETTTLPAHTMHNHTDDPIAFPYSYQIYICGYCFILRDRTDFLTFMYTLKCILDNLDVILICYVHNLSYEWQFFKSMLEIADDSVFALQTRRIAKFTAYECIEFRCSYLLSNMSLEKFTENYCDRKYWKDKELIDYEVARYPWTELSDEILYYSAMDVIGLHAAVSSIMKREGDNLRTIPMTNTGYVRRACRIACIGENWKHYRSEEEKKTYAKFRNYRKMFSKMELTMDMYQLQVDAFRGGNTHANRFKVGNIISNVGSNDFSSSYPAITICSDEFPMGKLMECTGSVQSIPDFEWYCKKYYIIVRVQFFNLRLRHPEQVTVPYIPKSKLYIFSDDAVKKRKKGDDKEPDGIYDNGRVIQQNGYCMFSFLGCEWEIIKKQYTGKMKIIEAYYTPKGRLPLPLRNQIYQWFKGKTELKGVEGMEYEYMKSKNRVNATYGMMVERIIKDIIECSDGILESRKPDKEEAEKQLSDYYTPLQHKFLAFQWGVVVTAMARVRLQEMIDIVGSDFVYCDTDSCKYENAEKYDNAFKRMNDIWIKYADDCGCNYTAYTKNGDLQILGIADKEHPYLRFATLGAKKYAYDILNKRGESELGITIAGVPKEAGANMLGKLENFKPGFKFTVPDDADNAMRQSWKKMLTYNDNANFDINIEGKMIHIGTYVAMERTTYDLAITDEYAELTGYFDEFTEDIEVWN